MSLFVPLAKLGFPILNQLRIKCIAINFFLNRKFQKLFQTIQFIKMTNKI